MGYISNVTQNYVTMKSLAALDILWKNDGMQFLLSIADLIFVGSDFYLLHFMQDLWCRLTDEICVNMNFVFYIQQHI
jgi:hypothetical protein